MGLGMGFVIFLLFFRGILSSMLMSSKDIWIFQEIYEELKFGQYF